MAFLDSLGRRSPKAQMNADIRMVAKRAMDHPNAPNLTIDPPDRPELIACFKGDQDSRGRRVFVIKNAASGMMATLCLATDGSYTSHIRGCWDDGSSPISGATYTNLFDDPKPTAAAPLDIPDDAPQHRLMKPQPLTVAGQRARADYIRAQLAERAQVRKTKENGHWGPHDEDIGW